jgi:hypothetical protein
MVHKTIVNPQNENHFIIYAMSFFTESDKPTTDDELKEFHIKSVDIIYNPEYDELLKHYRIPIFFKSGGSPLKRGFVDNGRQNVPIGN